LLIKNRLKRDQTGDVEILKRFWKPAEIWKYEDLPLTKQDEVWGKVVRLRKNL
jgi:hypothetical protein